MEYFTTIIDVNGFYEQKDKDCTLRSISEPLAWMLKDYNEIKKFLVRRSFNIYSECSSKSFEFYKNLGGPWFEDEINYFISNSKNDLSHYAVNKLLEALDFHLIEATHTRAGFSLCKEKVVNHTELLHCPHDIRLVRRRVLYTLDKHFMGLSIRILFVKICQDLGINEKGQQLLLTKYLGLQNFDEYFERIDRGSFWAIDRFKQIFLILGYKLTID